MQVATRLRPETAAPADALSLDDTRFLLDLGKRVRTLRDLVARHGFRDLAFHCYGRLPWLWKHMICVARKGH